MENNLFTLKGAKPVVVYYGADGDSEASAEGEVETENEDYTDYENEETEVEGGVPQADLPRYRDLVRNKKLELKAQYGKAHIERTTREVCVNVPYTNWDSNINCKEVCVKWNLRLECQERKNKCLGGFIGGTRRECTNVPHFSWVSGWRKQWREFKRNGGLAQLKLQSKGLLPSTPTQPTQPRPTLFGAILTTTAELNPLRSVRKLEEDVPVNDDDNTTDDDSNDDITDSSRTGKKNKKTSSTTDDKILGMPKDVAIGLGVAVVLIGGFALIRKII